VVARHYLRLLGCAALAFGCADVDLHATSHATADGGREAASFVEEFDSLDGSRWSCEGGCPKVSEGVATFSLEPGVAQGQSASWSKLQYRARRFTSGRFTVRFALGEQPREQVWWGLALWDAGPLADETQYSEINAGFTTSDTPAPTQLDFVSARLGKKVALRVDAGKNLYDGSFHTATLEYDAAHVALYLDGTLLETISDETVIPDGPLDLMVGTRLVTTPALTSGFDMQIDRCDIEW
jgi:hypothetical protein